MTGIQFKEMSGGVTVKIMLMRFGRAQKIITGITLALIPFIMHQAVQLFGLTENDQVDYAILAGKTVVVDAGHGGIDDGAKWNGIKEKEINLEIAQKLAQELKSHNCQVVMTRDQDIDYYTRGKGGKRNDLLKRVEIIENANADYYISIHLNAIRGSKWRGAQVFYGARVPESEVLAKTIQQAMGDFPPGNKRQVQKDLDIIVLNATTIPGVLVEAGFISNPSEAALLKNEQYQQKMAKTIVKALAYHIQQNAGR